MSTSDIGITIPTKVSELENDSNFLKVSDADTYYVDKTGDTMTGELKTTGLTVGSRLSGSTAGTNSGVIGSSAVASGNRSFAQGYKSKATANSSLAQGYATEANGSYSHSEGYNTVANTKSQHVAGEYNVLDTGGSVSTHGSYAYILGNGSNANSRSNAHTVDWSGNGWFAGDVYVGSTSGTEKDSGSKKLATVDATMDNYSTTERLVGTWIDGKPLYEIVMEDTTPTVSSNGTVTTKVEDIPNSDFAFIVAAFVIYNASPYSVWTMPYYNNSMYFVKCSTGYSSAHNCYQYSVISNGTVYNNCNVKLIIRYTKATSQS